MAGEYTAKVLSDGIAAFLRGHAPETALRSALRAPNLPAADIDEDAQASLPEEVPVRPPGFCTGCPERPIFSAMKLVEKELGEHQVASDIGCHLFSILPPFNIGGTTMGYGLGPASNSAFSGKASKRSIAVMGDGGFWHNGLTSGVGNAVFNKQDGVIIVVDNHYTAATGGQDILSSRAEQRAARAPSHPIEKAVRGIGVEWVRTIERTYDVGQDARHAEGGADHARQGAQGHRRLVANACSTGSAASGRSRRRRSPTGKRVVQPRFGVDEDVCTGDHACIRLSGCPSLSVKKLDDPLRDDPVAAIDESCVGCGNCGEVADAAVLCPSFYRTDLVHNPNGFDRSLARFRTKVIGYLQRRREAKRLASRARRKRRVCSAALRCDMGLAVGLSLATALSHRETAPRLSERSQPRRGGEGFRPLRKRPSPSPFRPRRRSLPLACDAKTESPLPMGEVAARRRATASPERIKEGVTIGALGAMPGTAAPGGCAETWPGHP